MISEHERLETFLRDLAQKRPFEDCLPQPDKEARKRLEMQAIPFAFPEKKHAD